MAVVSELDVLDSELDEPASEGVAQPDMVHGCLRARHDSPAARAMFAAGVAAIARFGRSAAR